MPSNDIFARLGLGADASAEEITEAYLKALAQCHYENCLECRKYDSTNYDRCHGGQCTDLLGLLTALEARGREAGRREVWEKLSIPCQWRKWNTRKKTDPNRHYVCSMYLDSRPCAFMNCLAVDKQEADHV
jgi:hypothetical protein